jgi:hypothetical protein
MTETTSQTVVDQTVTPNNAAPARSKEGKAARKAKKASGTKPSKTTKVAKASTNGKAPKATKAKAAKPAKAKREGMSALDAAAKVLSGRKTPMNAKELIDAMSEKGLWTSPGGATPHATLAAGLIKEIANKGKDSRFKKVAPGQYIATGK